MAWRADAELEASLQAAKLAARRRLLLRWHQGIETYPFWRRWLAILLRRLRYVAGSGKAGGRALIGWIGARLMARRG
ncbi:MAG: hypothetical protein ACR65Z_16270 [Methylocystis sp.]